MSSDVAAVAVSVGFLMKVAEQSRQANRAVQMARVSLNRADSNQLPSVVEGKTIDDLLFEAQELTVATAGMARQSAGIHAEKPGKESDLSDLALLGSPGLSELLAALENAQEIAERVDEERGRALSPSIPLQPGESRGTDLAESISYLALRVRTEVHGPKGRE